MQQAIRDRLGRVVREAWTEWAREQPRHAGEQFLSWDEMREEDKEGDRRIAEAVAKALAELLVPPIINALFDETETEQLLSTARSKEV
jgi:hypothetical protein